MKAFFRMTAAALLVVTMLFAALPEAGVAAEGKVTLAEMVKIKKAAEEAVQTAKIQAEKAKTAEDKAMSKLASSSSSSHLPHIPILLLKNYPRWHQRWRDYKWH